MADIPYRDGVAGKGKRVAGTFLLMLGAGIVLESTIQWIGGTIMLVAVALLVRGLLEARPHTAVDSQPRVAIDPQIESHL